MAASQRAPSRLVLDSAAPEATQALGERLGAWAFPGLVLALQGEMGSGKTTFVRGLARGLGCTEPVTSPTFTLLHEHAGRLPLWHLDAWMAERGEAFLEAGGADVLLAEGVAAVEWAERVETWLPRPRLVLALGHLEPLRRSLVLERLAGADPTNPLEAALEGLLTRLEGSLGSIAGLTPNGAPPEGIPSAPAEPRRSPGVEPGP